MTKEKILEKLEQMIYEPEHTSTVCWCNPIMMKEEDGKIKKQISDTEKKINAINDKAKFFIDKLKSQIKPETKNGLTFSELVAIVENSRQIQIDREMKLFEFHRIYELELKKWKNAK